jgi:ketosteroid isomerase-like protein
MERTDMRVWRLGALLALAGCSGRTVLYPRPGTETPDSAAVARAEPGTATDQASVIRAARLEQNEALRAGDIDRAAAWWAPDIIVLAGLGARVDGIDAVRQAFATDRSVVYERLPDEIHISDGWPLAWEQGRWRGYDAAAADSALITGRYSARWVRSEFGWRIQSEHFVADRCSGAACRWPLVMR